MSTAELLFWIGRNWLAVGGLVAVLFLFIGIDRIDEDARGAYVFRPLLIPAILLIWPLVLWRWWTLERGLLPASARYKPVRAAHGLVAVTMCILTVGIIIIGLSQRQTWPTDFAPQKLPETAETSQ